MNHFAGSVVEPTEPDIREESEKKLGLIKHISSFYYYTSRRRKPKQLPPIYELLLIFVLHV